MQQVTGFDSIAERIARESGFDIHTVRQLLQDYAGNESIRDLLGQLFFFSPGKTIHKRDQWVKNVTAIAHAPVKLSFLVTAVRIDPEYDDVLMKFESVVSAKTAENGREYASGKGSGAIAANYSTGMPYHIYVNQEVTTRTDQYDVVMKRVIRTPED